MIINTVTLPASAILVRLGFKLFIWLTKHDLGLPGHKCMPFLQGNCSLSKMGTYSRPDNLIISPTYIPSPSWAQKKISPISCTIGVFLKGPWTLIFLFFCTLCLCLFMTMEWVAPTLHIHIPSIPLVMTLGLSQNQSNVASLSQTERS